MHDLCMATKTISLELDAYEKLRRAKRDERDSFSSVVRRARWDERPPTAGEIADGLEQLARDHPEVLLGEAGLERLNERGRTVRLTGWVDV